MAGPLHSLYLSMENNPCSGYSAPGTYPIIGASRISSVQVDELLTLSRKDIKEEVIIGHFRQLRRINIAYVGDAACMKGTIDQLHVPSSFPENLGQKVFYLFRQALDGKEGSIHLEQEIAAGREAHLRYVLSEIAKAYAASNSTLV